VFLFLGVPSIRLSSIVSDSPQFDDDGGVYHISFSDSLPAKKNAVCTDMPENYQLLA
jgi:hypothetical protein